MCSNEEEFRVLIIEDDFKVAEINSQYVEMVQGFSVIGIAKTSTEAIAILDKEIPDLILLDTYIPDVQGLELLWTIRQEYKDVDVIMVTAAKEVSTIEEAMRGGVFDYVVKPVDFHRFKKALQDYASKKRFLVNKGNMDQEEIDRVLGITGNPCMDKDLLPKGISPLTLQKVQQVVESHEGEGITARQLGEKIGASRITARRYMEYLVSLGKLKAEVKYGEIGRPERRYCTP